MLSFVQNIFAPKANPIGVDFGSDTLRLAQVQRVSVDEKTGIEEFKLVAAASADVPSIARHDPTQRIHFFVETTRDLLAQGNFRGRAAILSLPVASMFIQHIRIAKLTEEETKKALPWEARGKLPIDPSHALMRHIIAGEVFQDQEPKNEVILLAAARNFVEQLLGAAAKAKLDIVGMNVEPKSIVDCFSAVYKRKSDADQTSMFVDIGCGSTRAIIAHGRQIHFARSIPLGGDQFNQVAASALNTTFEDAKMIRVQLCHAAPALDENREKRVVEEKPVEQPNESADNSFALLTAGMHKSDQKAQAPSDSATAVLEAPAAVAKAPKTTDLHEQGKIIDQAIREPLNRLIDELNLCRRYHEATFPNSPVNRMIFVVVEARQRGLCAHIAQEMGLAAQVGDPIVRMGRISDVGIESGIDRRQPQPNWAVAIGLSIGPGVAAPAETK
jgi:Tfp pilus assembly PilM family ATPase